MEKRFGVSTLYSGRYFIRSGHAMSVEGMAIYSSPLEKELNQKSDTPRRARSLAVNLMEMRAPK